MPHHKLFYVSVARKHSERNLEKLICVASKTKKFSGPASSTGQSNWRLIVRRGGVSIPLLEGRGQITSLLRARLPSP